MIHLPYKQLYIPGALTNDIYLAIPHYLIPSGACVSMCWVYAYYYAGEV